MKLVKVEPLEDYDNDFPEEGSGEMPSMRSWADLIGRQDWADASEQDECDFLDAESTTDQSSSTSSVAPTLSNDASLEPSRDLTAAVEAIKTIKKEDIVRWKLKNRTIRRDELLEKSSGTSSNSNSSDSAVQHRKLKNRTIRGDELLEKSSGTSSGSTSSDSAVQQLLSGITSMSFSAASTDSYFTASDGGTSESGCSSASGKLYEATRELEAIQLKDKSSRSGEADPNSQHESNHDLGDLPSEGALLHATFSCRPCMFVHTPIGCYKGVTCTFCHLSHDGRGKRRPRPCRAKRERYRKLISATMIDDAEDEEGAQNEEVNGQ